MYVLSLSCTFKLCNVYKNIVDNNFCYSYFHLFDDKNKTTCIILSKQHCNTNTCTCIFINTNMFIHMCICTHFTTSHYVYNYILMDIHKYIIVHTLLFIQILMSVAMEHITVLKHVLTLKEVSLVDVIVVIYWIVMTLPVMVCRSLLCILIHNVTHALL